MESLKRLLRSIFGRKKPEDIALDELLNSSYEFSPYVELIFDDSVVNSKQGIRYVYTWDVFCLTCDKHIYIVSDKEPIICPYGDIHIINKGIKIKPSEMRS